MTAKEKQKNLSKHIIRMCSHSDCNECDFFEPEDTTDGEYFCAIRDKDENVPYYMGWDMRSAMKDD